MKSNYVMCIGINECLFTGCTGYNNLTIYVLHPVAIQRNNACFPDGVITFCVPEGLPLTISSAVNKQSISLRWRVHQFLPFFTI